MTMAWNYLSIRRQDILQLVDESTRVMYTKRGISDVAMFDIAAVDEKYSLTPEKITDLKGLMVIPVIISQG